MGEYDEGWAFGDVFFAQGIQIKTPGITRKVHKLVG